VDVRKVHIGSAQCELLRQPFGRGRVRTRDGDAVRIGIYRDSRAEGIVFVLLLESRLKL
jgi:hypothetical protein